MPDKEAKSSIQVIERMMSLLEALARHSSPVNLKSLATETSLHPSTAHRILGVMVENRLVDRIEPGQYRLGMRLLELGNLVKSRLSVRQEALPYMHTLQKELGETVNLCVRHHDEVVYIERTTPAPQTAIHVVHLPGTRAPLHITAVGKVFLAHDGAASCLDYARRTGLPRFTDNTLSDADRLTREVERVKSDGFAFDNEEAEKGLSCIGAGIFNDEGRLIAGLSVSAPSDRLKKEWAQTVLTTAQQISKAIGHSR